MRAAPQLADGEEILHHHTPDIGAFKRTALLMLAITLVPTVMFVVFIPDTFWGAVPLFITCLLLMQERFTLGKYAAWITNRRVLMQGDVEHVLSDITSVETIGTAVRLNHTGGRTKLFYPKDKAALKGIIETAMNAARSEAT